MARALVIPGLTILGSLLLGAASPNPDVTAERLRLLKARADSAAAETRATRLDNRAKAERGAAARAQAEEAAIAERIVAARDDIDAAQARIVLVEMRIEMQRARLAAGEAPAARLLGALQALALRPAAVTLVQPGSIDDLVHVRAVLGATLPVIRARTAAVRAEIVETRRLRQDALLARQSLAESRRRLTARRTDLVRLEELHQRRASQFTRTALAASDQAIALGEHARDIADHMEVAGDQAETGAALASLPGPVERPARFGAAGAAAVPNAYRLAVGGRLVTGFGEISSAGVRARGLTLAVAPDAVIAAPASGRIAYAARFRRYGDVVIIDHGGGWTSLVSGLAALTVHPGDPIAAGAPIGRAPGSDDPELTPQVTIELRRRGRPVDMTPLLG